MLFNKIRYRVLLRAISVLLINAFLVSNIVWADPINSNSKNSLSRWTATQDSQANEDMFAAMQRRLRKKRAAEEGSDSSSKDLVGTTFSKPMPWRWHGHEDGKKNNIPVENSFTAAIEVHYPIPSRMIEDMQLKSLSLDARYVVIGKNEDMPIPEEFSADAHANDGGYIEEEWLRDVLKHEYVRFIIVGGSWGICHLHAFESIISELKSNAELRIEICFPKNLIIGMNGGQRSDWRGLELYTDELEHYEISYRVQSERGIDGPENARVTLTLTDDIEDIPSLGSELRIAQSTTDIKNALHVMNELVPAELEKGRIYEVRYDSARLRRNQESAAGEDIYTAEQILIDYVDYLRMRIPKEILDNTGLEPDEIIKLVDHPTSSREETKLISVTCYENIEKSMVLGEASVNISGDLKEQPLRIVGMLNIAFTASHIPKNAKLSEYQDKVSYIKKQYKEITGLSYFTKNIWDIELPHAKPFLGSLSEYYRLTIEQLHRAA